MEIEVGRTQGKLSGLAINMNKAGGCAVGGIYEMHVSRLSPRRVDGKKNQWLFQNLRQSVHDAALEEKKLPRAEFGLLAFVAHPECPPPGKDVEVFVALQVVMRRRASVDTENPRARDSRSIR